MKYIFKKTMMPYLPKSIQERKDKMGFSIPLNAWLKNELREFVADVFSAPNAMHREYIDNSSVLKKIQEEGEFSRNIWGLLSLELWNQEFHDKSGKYKKLLTVD